MKWAALFILSITSSFAGDSSSLMLRGRVPGVYYVEVKSKDRIITHSNSAQFAPVPSITVTEKNTFQIVTVTHP